MCRVAFERGAVPPVAVGGKWLIDEIPVTVTCRGLDLARQPYYRWLADPVTESEWREARLANALFDAHRDDPEFGYRFLADEARAERHVSAAGTAWKVCWANGWFSVFGKKKSGKKAKPGAPAYDDLVHRNFTAAGPNLPWFIDITEHCTIKESRMPA
jgi:transposase InsO family protein